MGQHQWLVAVQWGANQNSCGYQLLDRDAETALAYSTNRSLTLTKLSYDRLLPNRPTQRPTVERGIPIPIVPCD